MEHWLPNHTAISITCIPGSPMPGSPRYATVNAILLGLTVRQIAEVKQRLEEAMGTAFSPFTLLKIFLELEKRTRFKMVDIEARTLAEMARPRQPRIGRRSAPDEETGENGRRTLVDLHMDVYRLRGALVSWRGQLEGLLRYLGDFTSPEDVRDIDPHEYVARLIVEYDLKIGICDRVLQGANLGFQMVSEAQVHFDMRSACLSLEKPKKTWG